MLLCALSFSSSYSSPAECVTQATSAISSAQSAPIGAGGPSATYPVPTGALAAVLNAEPLPYVVASPDGQWVLLTHRAGAPGIRELAVPQVILAGDEIDLRNGARVARSSGTGMTLVRTADGKQWKLSVPSSGLSAPLWSPDGRRFVFRRIAEDRVELWVGDVTVKAVRVLQGTRLSTWRSGDASCAWMPDSRRVLCQEIPSGRGAPPEQPLLSPTVQESDQVESRVFAYAGQLRDAHDVALYEYYKISQPVAIDTTTDEKTAIGIPGLYEFLSPSPDGNYLLSVRTVPPYSYLYANDYRFGKVVEILDRHGRTVRTLMRRSLGTWGNARGWAPPGLRRFAWVPGAPAMLVYIEALDGGDPRIRTLHRDRLMRLVLPSGEPVELIRTQGRMSDGPELARFFPEGRAPNVAWLRDALAWVEEVDFGSRHKRVWLVSTDDRRRKPRLLLEFSTESADDRSGIPMLARGVGLGGLSDYVDPNLYQDGDWVYLTGKGESPEGDRPFLDRFNLTTLKRERLFRSAQESHEAVVAVLSRDKVLTHYETSVDPPNYYIRDLVRNERSAITNVTHPAPELRDIRPQLLRYTRDDGVALSGELYLPLGYKPGQRIPVLIWAYPRTYTDTHVAGAVRASPNSFAWSLGSARYELAVRLLVSQGYGLLWNPAMPVIGGERANDTVVPQLIANARAAVHELVRIGVADRSRIAIGGHSYGAFMAATLMAHSDLFAAGVAISGAYNRTNSPRGFQEETRTLWEAPDVYFQMSPLLHADKISAPLLLIHGEADRTHSTLPSEAQRFYQALDGLGRKARLVMFPYESHPPSIAKESVALISCEISNWLSRFVSTNLQNTALDRRND